MVPLLIQGIGAPFFFIPLTALALSCVDPQETASAAGLMNFLRTLSGAVSTSLVTTAWENQTNVLRTDLVSSVASPEQVAAMLGNTSEAGQVAALYTLDQVLQSQAVMLATNQIFLVVSCTFAFAAAAIWLAPKPKQKAIEAS
jgi:DHA2 family multidrug resistance protein